MTENRDFKRRIRLRMKKTGESYTAARARLLGRDAAEPPAARETRSLGECLRLGDLEGAMIALCVDADPRVQAYTVWASLDRLAERLAARVAADAAPGARLEGLLALVYGEVGFAVPEDYGDPALDRIDRVLDSRRGTPAAIAGLLVILGRRVGLDLHPVPFPGHFLVRVEGARPVFVDPASGGLLGEDALTEIAVEELGVSRAGAVAHLAAADARALVIRQLQNLGKAHRARGDEGGALLVADRLFEVSGGSSDRLDRALSLWALGAYEAAHEDLDAYLASAPDAPDPALFERARAHIAARRDDTN